MRPRKLWEALKADRDGTIARDLAFHPLQVRALKALQTLYETSQPNPFLGISGAELATATAAAAVATNSRRRNSCPECGAAVYEEGAYCLAHRSYSMRERSTRCY